MVFSPLSFEQLVVLCGGRNQPLDTVFAHILLLETNITTKGTKTDDRASSAVSNLITPNK